MTLPAPGVPMTAAMINVELGRAATAPFSMNDAAVRALAGKPTGPISMIDFYGKSASGFSASATPQAVNGTGTSSIVTGGPATATASGGTGPFTYSWSVLNQIGEAPVNVISPTEQSTSFSATLNVPGFTGNCNAFCVITDTANNQTRQTQTISVYLERT